MVMVMWFACVILLEFFSCENTPEGCTETHKTSFIPYKQVSRRRYHEWLRITNAFILCDLLWKVQKCYAANRDRWSLITATGLWIIGGIVKGIFQVHTISFNCLSLFTTDCLHQTWLQLLLLDMNFTYALFLSTVYHT